MGKDDRGRPSLDEFLSYRNGPGGPCKYVRQVPPELRAEISDKVTEGVRKWAGYSRWLKACGVDAQAAVIEYHYTREHADDR